MLYRPQHTIHPHEVHVWHLLTDPEIDAAMQHDVRTLLSAEEQARLQRLGKYRDRTLYALSRVLMRTVLASYLDCACHEVRFAVNSFGKPILSATGGLPLHFNLTHSRGAIALAISREREVGVDVEDRERRVECLALAERFFASVEARHLQQLAQEHRKAAFFAIWTLKEAFVKGIGRGLTFPLDAFCFDLEIDRLTAFRPLADFVSPDWHFHQFHLSARHCGALAVQYPACHPVKIEMHEWTSAFLAAPAARA